jgi:hypothetical protein
MAFMRALAINSNPIVWADGLASGLAALELGPQAFRLSKYDEPMTKLQFPYDVAILDLDIPSRENDGILDESKRTNEANALLKPFYKERSEFLNSEFLNSSPNCAGVILALKLMQKGMPSDRIFFLTAHGDILSPSAKALLGSMLPEQCLDKTDSEIDKLKTMIKGNSYYITRELIYNSISAFKKENINYKLQIFPFTKNAPYFKLTDINAVLALLDELQALFSFRFPGKEDEILRYRICIDLLAKHFDTIGGKIEDNPYNPLFSFYRNQDEDRIFEHPARHAARFLKNIRNIHAHTTYLYTLSTLDHGIIFIFFLNFIRAYYGLSETSFLPPVYMFFEATLPPNDNPPCSWDNDWFIKGVADGYKKIRKPGTPFGLAMYNFLPDLPCTPWDIVRMNFWAQLSFSPKTDTEKTYFDFNALQFYMRTQLIPQALASALAPNHILGRSTEI